MGKCDATEQNKGAKCGQISIAAKQSKCLDKCLAGAEKCRHKARARRAKMESSVR